MIPLNKTKKGEQITTISASDPAVDWEGSDQAALDAFLDDRSKFEQLKMHPGQRPTRWTFRKLNEEEISALNLKSWQVTETTGHNSERRRIINGWELAFEECMVMAQDLITEGDTWTATQIKEPREEYEGKSVLELIPFRFRRDLGGVAIGFAYGAGKPKLPVKAGEEKSETEGAEQGK